MKSIFLLLAALGSSLAENIYYSLQQNWPTGLNGLNLEEVTAVGIGFDASGDKEIYVAQRGTDEPFVLVLNVEGDLIRGWGNNATGDIMNLHGLMVQNTPSGSNVWVTDIVNASVKLFTPTGELLLTIAGDGSGTSIQPLQFSAPADIQIDSKQGLYISDGDGGIANRVMRLLPPYNVGYNINYVIGTNGTSPGYFNNPHSVGLDDDLGRFWVADRGNSRLQIFDTNTGNFIGIWNSSCFSSASNGNVPGVPWGIRIDALNRRAAVTDGTNGFVYVLDIEEVPNNPPTCSLLETFNISIPSKPHLLEVDQSTGDIYVANVGTPTTLQWYKRIA